MKPPIVNKEREILRELWRKAWENGGMEVPCGSKSHAIRLRFAMYNAVKPIRDGREVADLPLKDAIENCSLGMEEKKKQWVLRIESKTRSELMQIVAKALGGQEVIENVKTVEEREIEESQRRLLEKLNAEPEEQAPARVTPYYTR